MLYEPCGGAGTCGLHSQVHPRRPIRGSTVGMPWKSEASSQGLHCRHAVEIRGIQLPTGRGTDRHAHRTR